MAPRKQSCSDRIRGFTLIELIVVLAIVSLLVTIALPRYFHSVEKSNEAVLRTNLVTMRETLDRYVGDTGRYPDDLQTLVLKRYLRSIPNDPITNSASTWIISAPEGADMGAVFDVHSGATGKGLDGSDYRSW